jgi:beta-N-acetylhexosaminidase
VSRILIGLEGTRLSEQERDWLARPDVAGVVQFTRNFQSVEQFIALNHSIRQIDPDALICIDQEGGRVQRIREPCTILPPLRLTGKEWDEDEDEGLQVAYLHAWLMASEMLALGVDISFAPVLDLDRGCAVIGDRAFHGNTDGVRELGRAYLKGMHEAGMATTGKHFPGHGCVSEDTHLDVALDDRPFEDIAIDDLRPYSVALRHGLDAVMMAHVIYPQVCPQPAGYSSVWCRKILRERMGFGGVIFSDDLGMRAAEQAGNFKDRMQLSLDAGCDMVLVCRPDDVAAAMAQIPVSEPQAEDRRADLRARVEVEWNEFKDSGEREAARVVLQLLEEN